MTSTAISIPKNLLVSFDQVVRERGYSNRSEAIQDALKVYIQHYEWMDRINGEKAGTIITVYDGGGH